MQNHVFSSKGCFSEKKKNRQGCTTQITELGMHQNHHFQQISLKINKNQKINPPSTITIPESVLIVSLRAQSLIMPESSSNCP